MKRAKNYVGMSLMLALSACCHDPTNLLGTLCPRLNLIVIAREPSSLFFQSCYRLGNTGCGHTNVPRYLCHG